MVYGIKKILIFCLLFLITKAYAQSAEDCVANILNRNTQVDNNNSFIINNIPIPPGPVKARIVCERETSIEKYNTVFEFLQNNQVVQLTGLQESDEDSIPIELQLTAPVALLTPTNNTVQLTTTGISATGTQTDLTAASTGTFYIGSNPAIATVSEDGFITAQSSGNFIVTAVHEGVSATLVIRVVFSGDSDDDGMPDDYEGLNAINPGGSNLANAPDVIVNSSSESNSSSSRSLNLIDGNLFTSWRSASGDTANQRSAPYAEIVLPSGNNIAQFRVFGHRNSSSGQVFKGVFVAFDPLDNEVFNSGEVELLPPFWDITVPVDINDIQRVRFTATDDENTISGFAEFQLISRSGGVGLNLNEPVDADLDFDQDGLTNLEEFNLGTSIFLNDTDDDGLTDDRELQIGSSPVLPDTDFDGLLDGSEPDPTGNSDGDVLINILDADRDGDGIPDGVEVDIGTNLNGDDSTLDTDNDGLLNIDEIAEGTDPGNPDTDGDGILDGEEVFPGVDGLVTDPLRADSDRDGMSDFFEIRFGLNPNDDSDADIDSDGDLILNSREAELGTDPFNTDITPPGIVSIEPIDNATDVNINASIVIRFNEALNRDSVENNSESVVQLSNGDSLVPGSVALSADLLSVTFTPQENLQGSTQYSVTIDHVRDNTAGNLIAAPVSSSFTTVNALDTTRPTIISTSPSSAARDISINSPFSVQFSEAMDPASINATTFTVTNNITRQLVSGSIQVDASGLIAAFVPDQPWAVSTSHNARISSNVTDLAGNNLASFFNNYNFTTSFEHDTDVPEVVFVSPADGMIDVPVNAIIDILFSEPVKADTVLNGGVQVLQSGNSVAASIAFSDGNRRVTITSDGALIANSLYSIVIDSSIADLTGNTILNAQTFEFTTRESGDVIRPSVLTLEPRNTSVNDVPQNLIYRVELSEPINPINLMNGRFFVSDIDGRVEFNQDFTIVTFIANDSYVLEKFYNVFATSGFSDLAGNRLTFSGGRFGSFYINSPSLVSAPNIVAQSIADGATDIPVNALVTLLFDRSIGEIDLADKASLSSSNGDVEANVSLNADLTQLSIEPVSDLAANTEYTLNLNNITDLASNALTNYNLSFTTSAETAEPFAVQVTDVSPASGAVDINVNTSIIFTFNRLLDPVRTLNGTIAPMNVSVNGTPVAGSYEVSDNRLIFTPYSALPGNTEIVGLLNVPRFNLSFGVVDVAGNHYRGSSSGISFTTADDIDTVAPFVEEISPAANAVNVPADGQQLALIRFNESVQQPDITVFANGIRQGHSISYLDDRRVFSINGGLLAENTRYTIYIKDAEDLSGNIMQGEFVHSFSTASRTTIDNSTPSVTSMRPRSGASGVSLDNRILVYLSEPMDISSLLNAFYVSENGGLISGTINILSNGQLIEFIPDQPFVQDANIRVFLTENAYDLSGNAINNYQASFTTERSNIDRPRLVNSSPISSTNAANAVPVNTVIDLAYSEALDIASVNNTNIILRDADVSGSPEVSSTISLIGDRIIRVTPSVILSNNNRYSLSLVNIQDLDGQVQSGAAFVSFITNDVTDSTAPELVSQSPVAGAIGVSTNALIQLRFNESINPLSINNTTVLLSDGVNPAIVSTMSFSQDNQQVELVPHAALLENTLYTLSFDGISDIAGNSLPVQSTQFTTANAPDIDRPALQFSSPESAMTSVSPNAPIELVFDEAIDVTRSTIILRNAQGELPGVISFSSDATRATFVPDFSMAVGVWHNVNYSVFDLSGNSLSGSFSFTTTFIQDIAAPEINNINLADLQTGLPRNLKIIIELNEPVREDSINGVNLFGSSVVAIPVVRELDFANRILTLTIPDLLSELTDYTLVISGLSDLSGNVMADQQLQFTTGSEVDVTPPSIVAVDVIGEDPRFPAQYNVPINASFRVLFDERMDAQSLSNIGVALSGRRVAGTTNVIFDGHGVEFVPNDDLQANAIYSLFLSGAKDEAGNVAPFVNRRFSTSSFIFANFSVEKIKPIDTFQNAAVNSKVEVEFNQPVSLVNASSQLFLIVANGNTVSGTYNVIGNKITFTPDELLLPDTTYSVSISNLSDLAGNQLIPFASSFVTATSSTADTRGPVLVNSVPANNQQNIDVDNNIVLNFDEPIDPDSVFIDFKVNDAAFEADISTNSNQVIIDPVASLPAGSVIELERIFVRDFIGNATNVFNSVSYTAAETVDTVPLVVESSTSSTFTFNKPALFVGGENVIVLANGVKQNISLIRSEGNRDFRFSISGGIQYETTYTLIIKDVEDFSGNRLSNDYVTTFNLGVAPTVDTIDNSMPTVTNMRPTNRASGVSPDTRILVYLSEPMNVSSLLNAFYVSENGGLVTGTTNILSNGQLIEFIADQPFVQDAEIRVFLTENAYDLNGNAMSAYEASFTTESSNIDPPYLVASSPMSSTSVVNAVPVNTVIELVYSEALDIASINNTNVILRDIDTSGSPEVSSSVSLIGDRIIRVTPSATLSSNNRYSVRLVNIQDLDGQVQNGSRTVSFITNDTTDNIAPELVSQSPVANAVEVGTNALIQLRFNEAINPLSINNTTVVLSDGTNPPVVSTMSFSQDNRQVELVPHAALLENTVYTLSLDGVMDIAGNSLAVQSTQFTTADAPDYDDPVLLKSQPENASTDVPVNVPITLNFNEPIDLLKSTVRLRTGGEVVDATLSFDAGINRLSINPEQPLFVGTNYQVSGSAYDLSGNFVNIFYSFITDFLDDLSSPQIIFISPENGQLSVPRNARITIEFNEPIDPDNLSAISLSDSSSAIAITKQLENANQRLVLIPHELLDPQTTYSLVIEGVSDISGNIAPTSNYAFTSSEDFDFSGFRLISVPPSGIVPLNIDLKVELSQPVYEPSLVGSITLTDDLLRQQINGQINLSTDGKTVSFIPHNPLETSRRYTFVAGGMRSAFGDSLTNSGAGLVRFTTQSTAEVDLQAPQVLWQSPQHNSVNVAINTRQIEVMFNEEINLGNTEANFELLANSQPVQGSIFWNQSGVRFFADSNLAAGTTYTLNLINIDDKVGNRLANYSGTFTTSSSLEEDTDRPELISTLPADGDVSVALDAPIVLNFNEQIYPAIHSSSINVSSRGIDLAGNITVNGSQVIFTPYSLWPQGSQIDVTLSSFGFLDLASNRPSFAAQSFAFESIASIDDTAPQIVDVSPANGSENISRYTPVIIGFSEPIDPVSLTTNNVIVLEDGIQKSVAIQQSLDNQSLILSATWRASSEIEVYINNIQDFSGNPLQGNNVYSFKIASDADNIKPRVIGIRPASNASQVPVDTGVIVFLSEPVDPATVNGNFYLSQNGYLVEGQTTVSSNGQALEFIANNDFDNDARIRVFLNEGIRDLNGNTINNYRSVFTTDNSNSLPLRVNRVSPKRSTSTNDAVPLNSTFEIEYNKPLAVGSINSSNIVLRNGSLSGDPVVAANVTLENQGRVIKVVPQQILELDSIYRLEISSIESVDSEVFAGVYTTFIRTSQATDDLTPSVDVVSPSDGLAGVGMNSLIQIYFNELVNPISVNKSTIQISNGVDPDVTFSISLSNDNTMVELTPYSLLRANMTYTVSINGVKDLAGNEVIWQSTFTTDDRADFDAPEVLFVSPAAGSDNVPVNSNISLLLDEAVHVGTVNDNTFTVTGPSGVVAGQYTFAQENKRITFVPANALQASSNYNVRINDVRDLSGNRLNFNSSFTSSSVVDSSAPVILQVSPENLASNINLNAYISIAFDGAMSLASFGEDNISLRTSNIDVPFSLRFDDNNRLVTLMPDALLEPFSDYEITLNAVEDLSGNQLPSVFNTQFTTNNIVDVTRPKYVQADIGSDLPTNAIIQVQFDEEVNPLTLNSESITLARTSSGFQTIPVTVNVAADDRSFTIQPLLSYEAFQIYRLTINKTLIRDKARNILSIPNDRRNTLSLIFSFADEDDLVPPQIDSFSPLNGAIGIDPTSVIEITFNERISKVDLPDNAIIVNEVGGAAVEGTLNVNAAQDTVIFTPNSPLASGVIYDITVSSVKDLAGNQMTGSANSSFTVQ